MTFKELTKRKQNQIDSAIENICRQHCNGIEISVMDIPKVFAVGRESMVNLDSLPVTTEKIVAEYKRLAKN